MREMSPVEKIDLAEAKERFPDAPSRLRRMMGKTPTAEAATPVGDRLPKVGNRRDRRAIASTLRKYVKGLRK